jgi:hypothetical protein
MSSTSFASLSLDDTANINFSTMFKVRVGRDGALKEWDLPAALASRRSVFFKNALKDHGQNDCWKEGDERLVTLAEDDPEIFSLYLYVFYNEPLPLKSLNRVKLADLDKEDEELHSDQNKDQVQVDQTTLCHLYVFAEFLQDVRAKNKILCELLGSVLQSDSGYNYRPFLPCPEAVHIIWKGTKDESPARALLINAYTSDPKCGSAFGNDGCESVSDFPEGFIAQIIVALFKYVRNRSYLRFENYEEKP